MNENKSIFLNIKNSKWLLKNNSEGFSLIELMVAMCIMAIATIPIMSFFGNFSKTTTTQNVTADLQENLIIGLDYIVRDLRRAGYDPTGISNASVLTSSATSFQFTSDDEEDGDLTGTDENITYTFNGNDLQRTDSGLGVTDILLSNVDPANSSFVYYDSSGNATVTNADVRAVEINLQLTSPAGRDGSVTRSLTRRVKARNLP